MEMKMAKTVLTDEDIHEAFEASWATHGDGPTRFARIIEHAILDRIRARIPHTEEVGEVCTGDCKGCAIVRTLGLDEPSAKPTAEGGAPQGVEGHGQASLSE
jgi:hypothetical protein